MSRATKEINKITGAIINTSIKLIVYSLLILMLYEVVTNGYQFGYEIFYSTAVAAAPGVNKTITISEKESVKEIANMLEKQGLIKNAYIFIIQHRFYDYEILPGSYELNTSMTSEQMLQYFQEFADQSEQEVQD